MKIPGIINIGKGVNAKLLFKKPQEISQVKDSVRIKLDPLRSDRYGKIKCSANL